MNSEEGEAVFLLLAALLDLLARFQRKEGGIKVREDSSPHLPQDFALQPWR